MCFKEMTQRGFTLIELLISIVIATILLGIVVEGFASYSKNQAVEKGALKIASLLTEARSSTLASKNGSEYGVHFDTNSATLFEGDTYSAGASTNKSLSLDSFAEISSVTLSAGGSDIVFNKLTGGTSDYGTTTVSLTSSTTQSKKIVVHPTGLIEIK
jgi:prepilin-type N-terminal cleavage/methylation domain-containing protein